MLIVCSHSSDLPDLGPWTDFLWLIGGGLFRAVDDDDLDRTFLRLELQPKLLLNCGEDGRTGELRRICIREYFVGCAFSYWAAPLLCVLQLEFVFSLQAGLVEHGTSERHRQDLRKHFDRHSISGDLTQVSADAVAFGGLLQFMPVLRQHQQISGA